MEWFARATQREYGTGKRMAALLLGQVLFLVVYPAFIGVGAHLIDRWFRLPRLAHGPINPIVALLLMVPGILLVEWTIGLQFVRDLDRVGPPLAVDRGREGQLLRIM